MAPLRAFSTALTDANDAKRLYIPQGEINAAGLIGRVNIESWILLDYLRHWPNCKTSDGANGTRLISLVRLSYGLQDLPLLFPRRPKPATQINKLTLLVARLRRGGLIDTRRLGPRCYMRLTSIAVRL